MKHIRFPTRLLVGLASLALAAHVGHAQNLVVTPDKPDGIYDIGGPIHWSIQWKGEGPVKEATYIIKKGGQTESAKGTISLTDNAGTLETKLEKPGSLLVEVGVTSVDEKQHKAYSGALVAPDKITPAEPRPADFDSFWEDKLKELAAIQPNSQLEPGESNKSNVDYWKITLDNIRGTHIQGQLARPKQGDKFPALLIPQWAGVYPLQKSWATERAAEGWLVLNIEAHDLPIDRPEAFYKEQLTGPLKDYWAIGNDDRDTSHFLRMYLSCCQAVRYLTERPDWDGKTLVVSGVSQGGQQTLTTAALCPKITAALALVPAGCDMLGPEVNRAPGWPAWYSQIAGKNPQKVREASRYYDVENFATRIKCPVLVGIGLIDQVCPPAATFAALNQIQSPKEIIVLPQSEHQETHNSQRPYYQRWGAWMTQLRHGRPPPIKSLAAAEPATEASATNAGTGSAKTSSPESSARLPGQEAARAIEYLPPTHETYLKLAAETEAALQREVLNPWFPRCIDNDHGGFYANYKPDWQPAASEGKFSVFEGRMTWITAEVALRRPKLKEQFLPYTKLGEKFLNDVMWDKQSGGIFWGLGDDGKITPSFGDDKQLYGIGFCLYAAANCYRATKDPAALDLAQRIFRWVDEHAQDADQGGYFEWLKRDGTPIQPDPNIKQPNLRSGLPVGGKSMNTHIHYLETLTQLYEVWPDPSVRQRLEELLAVVRDKICKDPGVMNLYFTFDWRPTSDRDSYGHDIETAYLLLDAAEALGTANDAKTQRMARQLVDHCMQTGWDETYGGVYQEGPLLGKPDALAKDWWVQFEALNALLLMHQKYGQETDQYFKAFQRQWQFIENYQFDHEHPGVIESVQRDGVPLTQDKGRVWKAAYHDGRALLNVTDRLKTLAEKTGSK